MIGYPKYFLTSLISVLGLLWISGLLLVPAWIIFRLEQDIEWLINLSLSSGDLRHWLNTLHAAVGWIMMWLIGALWTIHMRAHWRKGENKTSGLVMAFSWAILALTALGIYYLGDADLSKASSLIHVILGLSIPIMVLTHRKQGTKSLKKPKI